LVPCGRIRIKQPDSTSPEFGSTHAKRFPGLIISIGLLLSHPRFAEAQNRPASTATQVPVQVSPERAPVPAVTAPVPEAPGSMAAAPAQSAPALAPTPVVQTAEAKAKAATLASQKADLDLSRGADAKGDSDSDTDAEVDKLKAGKLIRFGVTAGTALLMSTGLTSKGTDGIKQESAGVAAMPYVLLVPGYWLRTKKYSARNAFCAASYGADRAAALIAGRKYAIQESIANLSITDQTRYENDDPSVVAAVHKDAMEKFETFRDNGCLAVNFGIFVGKPLDFDASVKPSGKEKQEKRQVHSFLAAGVAYTPNAYVTFLAGVGYNYIKVSAEEATDTSPATPEKLRRYASLVLGLGGNLDLVGKLFTGI
jgi:hypothetical protein